jgi:hypothetical protein
MEFFFVQDRRRRYRFFSTEPVREVQVEFSRLKKIWSAAKKKLMLLPPRTLRQEQAFERILRIREEDISIHYAEDSGPRKIKMRFFFYLQKQRSKHLFLLLAELLLLPISGLMALLPGPNVFFGFLALIMITHWQAFRGINELRRKTCRFVASPLLQEWESRVADDESERMPEILSRIEQKFHVADVSKILFQ